MRLHSLTVPLLFAVVVVTGFFAGRSLPDLFGGHPDNVPTVTPDELEQMAEMAFAARLNERHFDPHAMDQIAPERISTDIAEPGPVTSLQNSVFRGTIVGFRAARPDDRAIRVGGHPDTYVLIEVSEILTRGIARFDAGDAVALSVSYAPELLEHFAGSNVAFSLDVVRGRVKYFTIMGC